MFITENKDFITHILNKCGVIPKDLIDNTYYLNYDDKSNELRLYDKDNKLLKVYETSDNFYDIIEECETDMYIILNQNLKRKSEILNFIDNAIDLRNRLIAKEDKLHPQNNYFIFKLIRAD